jgi:exopolysaccharide biosynthesis WecB/TagA/CpsF family protein
MNFVRDPVAIEACVREVESLSPFRFCFLAVGSPQQEIVAQALKMRGLARGLALCVGASINFITGNERRAPPWMRRIGIEWLYRLLQNPKRLAYRYLVRGPRIFFLLWRIELRTKRLVAPRDSA